jgi:hypothetical protein
MNVGRCSWGDYRWPRQKVDKVPQWLESLQKYFELFGEVVDCVVLVDRLSGTDSLAAIGKSRGFGFVTFASPAVVQTVLSKSDHVVDHKKVRLLSRTSQIDCKEAVPRSSDSSMHQPGTHAPRGPRGPHGQHWSHGPQTQQQPVPPEQDFKTKKLFVGGLHYNVTEGSGGGTRRCRAAEDVLRKVWNHHRVCSHEGQRDGKAPRFRLRDLRDRGCG